MKKFYAILIMAMIAISANAAGDLADWYLYVWSNESNAGGDRGQFKTTDTDYVFVLEGVTLSEKDAAGLNFCMRNSDWSTMYGWGDGGSLDATDKAVVLETATQATGWMSLPAGTYDFTWNATNLTITAKVSTTNGISTIKKVEKGNDTLYNLAGQRVNGNAKGILIKNGKKVIVK